MEKRRKATLQVQYSVAGVFIGAAVATSDLPPTVLLLVAVGVLVLPYLTNRYWGIIHSFLPTP